MQFLPKGAMNNVVPIYHYVNEANGLRRIKVGSAWKRRRQMTMRIDIYRDRMHEYDTYRTSDGQTFMPLVIPMQEFLDLGTRETDMGYAEANTDEDEMELVGYIRATNDRKNLKVSLNVDSILGYMAPNNYGNSMFAVVAMNAIKGIRDGTRAVGAVSMRANPSVRSNEMMTPFLINRISFSLGSRDDEA
jgi:hypothetical protein